MHSRVHGVVLQAYAALGVSRPAQRFVYGETGWQSGGSFEPHHTHQNGLSVDFLVPVLDRRGEVAELPKGITNEYGYALEFDDDGGLGELRIDFEAIAWHLAELGHAASEQGVGVRQVIFAPKLRKKLERTKAWPRISSLPFTKAPVWVRHDDHYHVDFEVPCATL